MGRFLKAFKSLENQKTCIYACFTFDSLSTGMREVEGWLSSRGVRFKRVMDPTPEFVFPDLKVLYNEGRFPSIIEVRDELSRAFYLFSIPVLLNMEGS